MLFFGGPLEWAALRRLDGTGGRASSGLLRKTRDEAGERLRGVSVFFFGEKRRSEELVEKLVGRLGSRGDREGELVEKLGGEERRGIAAMIPSFFFISI